MVVEVKIEEEHCYGYQDINIKKIIDISSYCKKTRLTGGRQHLVIFIEDKEDGHWFIELTTPYKGEIYKGGHAFVGSSRFLTKYRRNLTSGAHLWGLNRKHLIEIIKKNAPKDFPEWVFPCM